MKPPRCDRDGLVPGDQAGALVADVGLVQAGVGEVPTKGVVLFLSDVREPDDSLRPEMSQR